MSANKAKRRQNTEEVQRRDARGGGRAKKNLRTAASHSAASESVISTRPTPVLVDAIFDELARELRELFRLCGYGANELTGVAGLGRDSGEDRHDFFPFKGDSDNGLVPAGRLLQIWHCDPQFLDERGAPLALKLTGAKSFETLLRHAQCWFDVRAVRDTLIEANFVKMSGAKLSPVARAALAGDREKVHQALFCLGDFVRTLQHNLTEGMDPSKALFQRFACDTAVPRSRVEEFKRFFNTQAMALLLNSEEWLYRAEQEAQGREVLQRVNVHVFLSPFVTETLEQPRDAELTKRARRKSGSRTAKLQRKNMPTDESRNEQMSLRVGEKLRH